MTIPKQLTCPECGGILKEVYCQANYGRVLLLDQCQVCGGVWFDRWELYFVTDESIKTLESVDASSFTAPVEDHSAKGLCPRCEKGLFVFTDPNLPKDALISRCANCNGLWLNRGELGKYAAHRRTFRAARPEYKTAELSTLKNLQKELKLDNIAMPTTTELALKLQQDEQIPLNSKEVAKDIAFLALQSLIRLVFKI